VRLELASGVAVAKVVRTKFRGVRFEVAKSIEEKEMPPEITSGTPEMVVTAVLQVIIFWIAVTLSWTSAGRAVLPIMKQGFAPGEMVGAGWLGEFLLVLRREGEMEEASKYLKEPCS
jgi:hypothetical protein